MGNLYDQIGEALANFMRDSYGLDVDRVVSWEDTTLHTGYCSTCYYEYAGVEVEYIDSKGKTQSWEYNDSMAYLIRNL